MTRTTIGIICLLVSCLCWSGEASDNETQGQALASEMRELQLGIPGDIRAILKTRLSDGRRLERRLIKQTRDLPNGWQDVFELDAQGGASDEWVVITHLRGLAPIYHDRSSTQGGEHPPAQLDLNQQALPRESVMKPLGESGFWLADLGLEFLHWPQQRLIAHRIQMRKGVSCQVLESRREPSLQVGYDWVRAWVSREHGGIIYAEAYNAAGKKIKIFEVNDVQKVEGRWFVKELKIRDLAERTTSILAFEVEPGARP